MILQIENIGKISKAKIELDGLTVICGDNNTGKSTVGKILFSFFNAVSDFESKILVQRIREIREYLRRNMDAFGAFRSIRFSDELEQFLNEQQKEEFTAKDIETFFKGYGELELTASQISDLLGYFNASKSDLMNEYVYRYFDEVMNGQVKKIDAMKKRSLVTAQFKDGDNTIKFYKEKCAYEQKVSVIHGAYYINNPFALDSLNNSITGYDYLSNRVFIRNGIDTLNDSLVSAIMNAQRRMSRDKMENLFDSVINKKDLDEVKQVLSQAYTGQTVLKEGTYYYREAGMKYDFDFRNISTGLKAFALLERMLATGVLKKKDVLILDEPEIHLHPEWQIIYAETIVLLQKKFDLTVLLVTHSFQFLESLVFFMKKYNISERGHYYTPEKTKDGYEMIESDADAIALKQNLIKGSDTLMDLEYEYELTQDASEDE